MISKLNRKRIFDIIIDSEGAFGFAENNPQGIIPFLKEVWDLSAMPSEDARFIDAEQDVYQHTINNNDWPWRHLFEVRLKVLEEEGRFRKFLEAFFYPNYQRERAYSLFLVGAINSVLSEHGLRLAATSEEDGYIIFELADMDVPDRFVGLPTNMIPFYVLPYPGVWVDKYIDGLGVDNEKQSRYFLLIADNWDDFGCKTTFWLVHFEGGIKTTIGEVKIGSRESLISIDVLPQEFKGIPDGFFSLGQSDSYYKKLDSIFSDKVNSVLYALKDVAFFSDIAEDFDSLEVFKSSLIRDDSAERLLRTAKAMIRGADLKNLYSFRYSFRPAYADAPVLIPFGFSTSGVLPTRMIAIIGKNGAGKTQLLTAIPKDIADGRKGCFVPAKPEFSKIIALSYSAFDNFNTPKRTAEFNYIYCGLKDESGKVRDSASQRVAFNEAWNKIQKLNRMDKWKKIISNFIDIDLIELFIRDDSSDRLFFDEAGFEKASAALSSGQSIVLFVMSEIVANIRFDSLILFDEPETHLHPNAISQLVNGIAELVAEFESFCIMATHSPLIIQEMFSRDVLIVTREDNILSVKKIGLESFGENLSVITDEIFGNRSIPRFYEKLIGDLVDKFDDIDYVLGVLKAGNLPLSLNVRLYLQSLVQKNVKN